MPACCVALHLSSLRRTKKVRLIPRDLRALPPEPFTALLEEPVLCTYNLGGVMYFWNIKALKHQLTEVGLSEADSMKYILFLSLLGLIPLPIPPSFSRGIFIFYVINTFTLLCGILYCYRKNGGAKGKDFLSRFFSINFVMFIRFIPFLMISGLIIYSDITKSIISNYQKTMHLFIVYIVVLLVFYRTGYHISTIADYKITS